jgi:hypothetical protein
VGGVTGTGDYAAGVEGIEENGVEGVEVRPGREFWLRCCVNGDEVASIGCGFSLDCWRCKPTTRRRSTQLEQPSANNANVKTKSDVRISTVQTVPNDTCNPTHHIQTFRGERQNTLRSLGGSTGRWPMTDP